MVVIPDSLVPGLHPLRIDLFRGITFPQSGGRVVPEDQFVLLYMKSALFSIF